MAYWLFKSEPEVYPFEQLAKDKVTFWHGVRNFTARNNMKAMKAGDQAFFYHSNADPPCIVGTVRVVKEAYVDPTQFEKGSEYEDPTSRPERPKWYMVDVAYDQPFSKAVTREDLKARPELKGMALWKYGRLSVGPVSPEEWGVICRMGGLEP
jgi:predicted RNA-binding protein with PUA-like domain